MVPEVPLEGHAPYEGGSAFASVQNSAVNVANVAEDEQQQEQQEEEEEDPYAGMDPEERLRMEIHRAQDTMQQFDMSQPTEEEIEQLALEEALTLHQMSVAETAYLSQHSSTIVPGRTSPANAGIHFEASAHQEGDEEEEEEVKIETEMQKFQARIKRTVEKDIKKMLLSSKAYVKHHATPPTISQAQIKSLAQPRLGLLHAEVALSLQAGSHDKYAKRKTAQLQEARERAEAEQARLKEDDRTRQLQRKQWDGWRQEREKIKSEILAQEAKQQEEYGKQVSKFLRHKAQAELAQYSQIQAARKNKATALHEQHKSFPGKVGERGTAAK